MNYKIKFKNSVSKDFKKIDKSIAKDILDKIDTELSIIDTELSINAEKNPTLKGKFEGLRKFRVGNYRIIYSSIETDTVLILSIAHRKEAYRK